MVSNQNINLKLHSTNILSVVSLSKMIFCNRFFTLFLSYSTTKIPIMGNF